MHVHTVDQTTDLNLISASMAPFNIQSESDVLDPSVLRAIADLADTRGDARFTPGGGVLFDTPITRAERSALPQPQEAAIRFLDLPQDRYNRTLAKDAGFRSFVQQFTVPHAQPSYRLVVIPMTDALSAAQLRVIADVAESFGHSTIRLTAGVSIRLPNVPVALLRPLCSALEAVGLLRFETAQIPTRMAA